MAESNVGFWSYAHDDNELDDGRVLDLAGHLKNEYALLTGESLDIFVDREALAWGDTWRARIDGALVETTFFIPIITPRYFTREECRRELLAFSRETQRRAVPDLVLPILYVTVPDLNAENPDEAVALVARRQYVDWRDLRLSAINSVAYRTAVNGLAVRLAKIAKEVSERQVASELAESADIPQAGHGLLELAEAVEGPVEEWATTMLDDELGYFQYDATAEVFDKRMKRAGSAGARYALVRQHAEAQLPIAEAHLERVRAMATAATELDADVTSALLAIAEKPSRWEFFPKLRAALFEVRRALAENDDRFLKNDQYASQGFREFANITRTMGTVANLHARAERYVDEARATFDRWFALAAATEADAANSGVPPAGGAT
ncbi:toll/interleukin-1 receptor domain-containing protein [Georgenia sp. 10Sc9-8]|uniref:Toll/interleukin-1 receptor domain-containing protein n=1 Tax=Georgenia halotolerans TaxID=3028317 RepID=A0ABT5TXF1_9MICO|nr:toll/interleukin-1 receptor domain-containing protein [Georgenia halotolerans]